MLKRESAITKETREYMNGLLDKVFEFKNGESLDDVLLEVLHDRDVFLYLLNTLAKGQGIELGRMSYWDDISVGVPYGLTIDYDEGLHPRTALFSYEQVGGRVGNLALSPVFFPKSSHSYTYDGIPTPEHFAELVNHALRTEISDQRKTDLTEIPPLIPGQ